MTSKTTDVPLVLKASMVAYLACYVLEGPLRYGLNTMGADALIFIRDALVAGALAWVLASQVLRHRVDGAFLVFAAIVAVHGCVMLANFHLILPVVYGTKVLAAALAGAVAAPMLMRPGRGVLRAMAVLWLVTVLGVVIDKFLLDFPWTGLEATIGDITVDVGRDWANSEDIKRAGGFARSSIHVAHVAPFLAILLMVHLRSGVLRIVIALVTVLMLLWVTQKGAIIAFGIALAAAVSGRLRSANPFKWVLATFLPLMVALPLILPGYDMPTTSGIFSLSSFYGRIEEVWPPAWEWIDGHQVFPFGVGLGGISGAQRLYAPDQVNYADNMFLFLYATFGLMSVVYMGLVAWWAARVPARPEADKLQALMSLCFLAVYGVVLTVIEDQMGALFLGACLATLARRGEPMVRSSTASPSDRLSPAVATSRQQSR